jgi:spore maturation protein CgeB
MKVLYIGHYEEGSTSGMRGKYLKKILQPEKFVIADISIPVSATNKIFRSLGWRFYKGPLISNINSFCDRIQKTEESFDLVWIDKGVFLKPSLVKRLKNKTGKLIHYTPDTAFTYNRSQLFYAALPYYDHCITTKSFELEAYKKTGARNTIFCTQGYDPGIHKPSAILKSKTGVAFAGLCEPYREEIVARLLEAGIPVKLSGMNWDKLVSKYSHTDKLQFLGNGIFGAAYASFYSESLIGLGLLSKKFPELHTTRLFEIPACGTALVTERNQETTALFSEDEVIFYNDINDIVERVQFALANPDYLTNIALRGNIKVKEAGYDYENILRSALIKTGVLAS